MRRFSGRPKEAGDVAAALCAAIAERAATVGRPLDRYEVFGLLRDMAGDSCWDAMPAPDSVGALRLIWRGAGVPSEEARFLLVAMSGRCFVEGLLPADPMQRAEYLELRRRWLAALAEPVPPSRRTDGAAYDRLVDHVAEGIADLVPTPIDDTIH